MGEQPLVRDVRVAQIFNPCSSLPRTFTQQRHLELLEFGPVLSSQKIPTGVAVR